MIKAEGAWAPRLRMGLLQAVQGLKIGLWVPGAVGRDQDGHWSLGSPEQSHLGKVACLPPWLFCPGDGMGCAGSSSRSGAAWLAGGGARGSHSLPASLPRAVCSPFHGSPLGKLLQHNYADNYNMRRYLQRRKRARHANTCLQCSLRPALLGGDVLYMYVHAVYCMPRYIEPEMEVQIDIKARQHRPSCPSCQQQVGYCGIKLTLRVQAGKRGGVFASFLLVSPASSCFACLLLFLLTVLVHPGMRIPARVFLMPARQPAPASLTDGPACQQAYPTCSSPWTSVCPAKTSK